MLINLDSLYSTACLVSELDYEGQSFTLWGLQNRLWIEGSSATYDWQGVNSLLAALAQHAYENANQAPSYYSDFQLHTDGAWELAQAIASGQASLAGLTLIPSQVSSEQIAHWLKQLEWTQADLDESGPLHFFRFATLPSVQGPILPIELFETWLDEWSCELYNWMRDRRQLQAHLDANQAVMTCLAQQQKRWGLDYLDRWARWLDYLPPEQESSHEHWNQLYLALEPHGFFKPEDGGDLGYKLVQQGHVALARYREAALAIYAHAEVQRGILLPNCFHPLTAAVSLHWFRSGPFHDATQDVLSYLDYGLGNFLDNAPAAKSGSFVSCQSIGRNGWFKYAKAIASTSQLYLGGQPVWPSQFDGYRLSQVAARLSRSGHTIVARLLAAFAILHDPDEYQHWIELGMSLWYEDKKSRGLACLEYAAAHNGRFSHFVKQLTVDAPKSSPLPAQPGQHYFDAALSELAPAWNELPPKHLVALIWLRSLVAEPRLEPYWFHSMDQLGEVYLSREILRGLPPAAQKRYLAQQQPDTRQRLQAHLFEPLPPHNLRQKRLNPSPIPHA